MARFETDGLDDVLEEMERMGETIGETADKMLMAGAEEVKKAWKASAERNVHRDTGDMIASINYPRKPKTANGIRSIDIYPQGKDKKGVRNATKAFVLNYGTSKHKGSHFVDQADDKAAEPVQTVYRKIWDEHLKGT